MPIKMNTVFLSVHYHKILPMTSLAWHQSRAMDKSAPSNIEAGITYTNDAGYFSYTFINDGIKLAWAESATRPFYVFA